MALLMKPWLLQGTQFVLKGGSYFLGPLLGPLELGSNWSSVLSHGENPSNIQSSEFNEEKNLSLIIHPKE